MSEPFYWTRENKTVTPEMQKWLDEKADELADELLEILEKV